MALNVVGAGFGRTGTFSLKTALEKLGLGPCHHLYEIRDNPSLLPPWQAAIHGEVPDWDLAFAGYNSQVDWPGSRYWKQLHRYFPDAKVILTVRDPEQWFRSLSSTVVRSITIGRKIDENPHTRAVAEMIFQTVYVDLFQGRMEDRDFMLNAYAEYVQEVRDTVPARQLLVFDVNEGWAPLCAFLGTAIPDLPFPKTNSTADFLRKKPFLAQPGEVF